MRARQSLKSSTSPRKPKRHLVQVDVVQLLLSQFLPWPPFLTVD